MLEEADASGDDSDETEEDGEHGMFDDEENVDPMANAAQNFAAQGACLMVIGYDSNDEEIVCESECNPCSQICKTCLRSQQRGLFNV